MPAITAESRDSDAPGNTGDRHDLLQRVFDRSAEELYRYILFRVGGNRDRADDLLQQTCCAAVQHRRPPDNEDECAAWLRGIARNLIRKHQRGWRREKGSRQALCDAAANHGLPADPVGQSPAESAIREETKARLMSAITALAAADQDLIFAYYFEGRPQAALARDLGVSEKSIERRLYRVRGRLRAALQDGKVR